MPGSPERRAALGEKDSARTAGHSRVPCGLGNGGHGHKRSQPRVRRKWEWTWMDEEVRECSFYSDELVRGTRGAP